MFFWEVLQARLKEDQEKMLEFNESTSARRIERLYGPAVVVGHEHDGESNRDYYGLYCGGNCVHVSLLNLRPADME